MENKTNQFKLYLFEQALNHLDWKNNLDTITPLFSQPSEPKELTELLIRLAKDPKKFSFTINLLNSNIADEIKLHLANKLLHNRNVLINYLNYSNSALALLEKFPQALHNEFQNNPIVNLFKRKDYISTISFYFDKLAHLLPINWIQNNQEKLQVLVDDYFNTISYTYDKEENYYISPEHQKILQILNIHSINLKSDYQKLDGFSRYDHIEHFDALNVFTKKIIFFHDNNLMDYLNPQQIQQNFAEVIKKCKKEIKDFNVPYDQLEDEKFNDDLHVFLKSNPSVSVKSTEIDRVIIELIILNRATKLFNAFIANFEILKEKLSIPQEQLDDMQNFWNNFFAEKITCLNDSGDSNLYASVENIQKHLSVKLQNHPILSETEKALLTAVDISKKSIRNKKMVL